MRLLFSVLAVIAALGLAHADDRPQPQTKRAIPELKLSASLGWQLSAVQRIDEIAGKTVLIIEGDVINSSGKERAAPKVRLAIRDDEGTEIFHWTVLPDGTRVKPHDWVPYAAKLESPPMDMKVLEIQTIETE